MLTATQFQSELAHFTGDLTRFRHSLVRSLIYTPGVKHFCEKGGEHGAYWVLDAIASYQATREINRHKELQYMQFWTLTVKDGKAKLVCQADSGVPPAVEQDFEYTDMQEGEWQIWVGIHDERTRTAYLPSEH